MSIFKEKYIKPLLYYYHHYNKVAIEKSTAVSKTAILYR